MRYKFSMENFEILLSENARLMQELKRLTIDYNVAIKLINALKKGDRKQ